MNYRDEPLVRIALALETLAGCTGWVDPDTGARHHDGDTCPLHESADADSNVDSIWLKETRAKEVTQ